MRLTFRLVGTLLVVVLVVIMVGGYLSVARERALFIRKMHESALLLGETTAPLFKEVWLSQSPQRALDLIAQVNRSERQFNVRWVSLDLSHGDEFAPRVSLDSIRNAHSDSSSSLAFTTHNKKLMALYLPVDPGNLSMGWLEMSQSYAEVDSYIKETIIRTLVLSLALVLLAGGMHLIFGTFFIGRPLQQLIEQTRRIGEGDFTPLTSPVGSDELSQLSVSLNQTSRQLDSANKEIQIQTEHRLAALEQLRHTERLATVGRLASGIAHELGTPLNVISGRAKMIASGDLTSEESTHSSNVIAEQSDRMAGIIRQLLDFARRRKAERTPVDLVPIIKGIVDLLQPEAHKAKVTLQTSYEPSLPRVPVDQSQIQQALINVIVNGMQAMPHGGNLTVSLSRVERIPPGSKHREPSQWIAIAVRDEGTGIPEEHLQTIFDPFFTTKEVGSGTGLGLSITHGIITDHRGFIEVDSKQGEGTTITLLLPVEDRT